MYPAPTSFPLRHSLDVLQLVSLAQRRNPSDELSFDDPLNNPVGFVNCGALDLVDRYFAQTIHKFESLLVAGHLVVVTSGSQWTILTNMTSYPVTHLPSKHCVLADR